MLTVIVIIAFLAILVGMAISVYAFGTGGKRANIFKDIYFSIEEDNGIGVVYTKTGEYSAVLKIENPVQKFSADVDKYYEFNELMSTVMSTIGEGYAIHKQDIFVRKRFDSRDVREEGDRTGFLTDSYFRFFEGRPYTAASTYIVITQESKKAKFLSYDAGKYRDFHVKVQKVIDIFSDRGLKSEALGADAVRDYVDRFFAVNYRDKNYSFSNFNIDSEVIDMGDRKMKIFSLIDVDSAGLPGTLRPYVDMTVNNAVMSVDLMSEIDSIPDAETVIFNQIIFNPYQKKEMALLAKKKNRHSSLPNPSNQIVVEDIGKVENIIAREGKQLVYSHFNVMVCVGKNVDMQKVTNHVENIFAKQSIHISKHSFNQLELFVSSFPGNCYRMSSDYDRFLTLSEAALCLMYKEHQTKSEVTPLKVYFTDRQGVPVAIDITGKEGAVKHTNNSNFFVLGPSGSGKSFFCNSVFQQLYEQETEMVIVDTGDSYEGISKLYNGTYISYTKENPISMNPFKVTPQEYSENFGEKKNFLKSLIFLIFKGNKEASKIEDAIINQTIVEYYQEYFNPFKGFSDQERMQMHAKLMLEAKKNGEYDEYEEKLQEKNGTGDYDLNEDDREFMRNQERVSRLQSKLQGVIEDDVATAAEKVNAAHALQRITPAVVQTKFLEKIERDLDKIERNRKLLRITELNFNSYYEFAIQRIPQIMREKRVKFDIDDFATILGKFYKGGEMEYTLNNDMDASLFDEKFIVFEIDKVKDDKELFPIIVLIIMDVFTQKMRIKKGRKCLVIEEAWKAIATPVMAEYIKYLYKTARKHWAMVGVVTQEIQDITSSPIVKEAIISNSDVFMLLDQAKFKDKFDDIKATLALTEIDCKKIFTINRLDNKNGRPPFKEVFIKRIDTSDVFGVEVSRECYMSFTTEKVEKEALKLYQRELRCTMEKAIEAYIRDWNMSGISKSLEFARLVMQQKKVLNLQQRKRKY